MGIGDDVLFQSFFGDIYEIGGVNRLDFTIGTSNDPLVQPAVYEANNMLTSEVQIVQFAASRIEVIVT